MRLNLDGLPELITRAKDVLKHCGFSYDERLGFAFGVKASDEQYEKFIVSKIALLKFGAISSKESPFGEIRGDRGKALKYSFEKTGVFTGNKKDYSKDEFVGYCTSFLNEYYAELAALKEKRRLAKSEKLSKESL